MALETVIEELASSRNIIRNKMVAAGQATKNDTLAELALNLNIGTDTSDATVDANNKILDGYSAYAKGVKYTGTCKYDADTSTGTLDNAKQLLSGKVAYSKGTKYTGSMPNVGSIDTTVDMNDSYDIPEGYHDGTGKVKGPTITQRSASSETITSAKTYYAGYYSSSWTVTPSGGTDTSDATVTSGSQILSGYSAYSKGTKYTGSITSRSASSETISSAKTYYAGYYSSNWTVTPATKNLQFKSTTIAPEANWSGSLTGNVTISPDSGYDGMSSVNVNVSMLRDNTLFTVSAVSTPTTVYNGDTSQSTSEKMLRIAPTKDGMAYTASYLCLGKSEYMGNATASDVVSGKTFSSASGIQITGTGSSGTDTSDATVTSGSQILSGYSAYSKGTKYTGSITSRSASSETITSAKTYYAGYYSSSWTVTPSGGTDTSDATVTSSAQILSGYSAYSKGTKYTGTGTMINAPNLYYAASIGNLLYSYDKFISNTSCFALFDSNQTITSQSIVIGNNITDCRSMFHNCFNFNGPVTIGNNVTNCFAMFENCYNFNQPVTIPNKVINCAFMFWNCQNFNQPVNIGNNVNNCSYMFGLSPNFNQPIIIPNNVTICDTMFTACTNFNQSVTIGNNVTSCSGMFANCHHFNQPITIPNNVINCRSMFENCQNFNQPVTISNNVTSCARMFVGCANMASNIYIKKKTNLETGYMLNNKNNSKRINIFCNNFSLLTGNKQSNSITGTDIFWSFTTNCYYNATYNIYLYNNYS